MNRDSTTIPSDSGSPDLSAETVRRLARDVGFDDVGIAPIRASQHATFLRDWLARRRHGDMAWLARPDALAARVDPRSRWPGLRSAIVVTMNYAQAGAGGQNPSSGVIARYARGRDYHRVMKRKLLTLLHHIEDVIGHELPEARAYVDTGPVLEREMAQLAGLGWFGRNTMLIHPRRGSYFFLGVLLVELDLPVDATPVRDHCGTCNACVDGCPTGALLGRDANGAPVIDATRCISYLTIEHRGSIPLELRPLIGNRVFGCDICQEVCPWNTPKFVEVASEPAFAPRTSGSHQQASGQPPRGDGTTGEDEIRTLPGTASPSLVELMRMERDEWDRWTRASAIRRAGYAGLKRNAAVAMGNWLASVDDPPQEAIAALRDALEDDEPLVREHAAWALRQRDTGQRLLP